MAGPEPIWTASRVMTGGPRTKISSSSTDSTEYAVRSAGVPPIWADHLARTRAPTFGYAPPATAAEANKVQGGASAEASHTNVTEPIVATTTCGATARSCP